MTSDQFPSPKAVNQYCEIEDSRILERKLKAEQDLKAVTEAAELERIAAAVRCAKVEIQKMRRPHSLNWSLEVGTYMAERIANEVAKQAREAGWIATPRVAMRRDRGYAEVKIEWPADVK